MSEEEKFDELLRSRLSERDFLFNESSWDDAERLINRREKRQKVAGFLLIFVAGLVAGTLIMLPLIFNTHTALPGVAAHSANGQNKVESNNPAVANQPEGSVDNTGTKEQKTVPSIPESDTRAGVQSAFVKKNDTRTGTQSTPAVTSVAKYKHAASMVPVSAGNHSGQPPVKSNRIASVARDEVSAKDNNEPVNKDGAVNSSSPQALNKPVVKASPSVAADTNAKATQSNTITANNSKQQNNRDTSAKKTASDAVIAVNNTSIAKKSNNGIRYPDTSQHAADNDVSSIIFHNIFSVYAGGTYSFGWGGDYANEASQGKGITPWAGFNFTHYFTPKISASLGIGYAELSGLSDEYSNNFTQYGFGLNEKITTVTPQLVYYIAIPFKVQYDIDSKDLFGIGCNYLLMMTTYSTLTTSQQIDFSATATSEKQNGYTQGFSNSDWQLTFSYTRMLMSRLGISVEYFRDFDYIENNTISTLSQSVRNNGFRLVISYQLLR